MKQSKIEWTDTTWNVSTGCTQISSACANCYAKAMTKRLQGMAKKEMDKRGYKCDRVMGGSEPHKAFTLPKYSFGFDKVIFHPNALLEIKDKKKFPSGKKVFVNSMSDLFHEDISDDDIHEVFFSAIRSRKDLIFQVLTKRTKRMFDFFYKDKYIYYNAIAGEFSHLWLGVTAENQAMVDERIPYLLEIKECLREVKAFVSTEPMLEYINIEQYVKALDWVICGSEKIPNNAKKARELNAK